MLQINPKEEGWNCRNSKCTKHSDFIQSKYSKLVNLWLEASDTSLPHTSNNGNHMHKTVPGWNEHVRDRKLESKRCHDAWVRAGKPPSTHNKYPPWAKESSGSSSSSSSSSSSNK